MNNEQQQMINELKVITDDNKTKEQTALALQVYLEANKCKVEIKSFTIPPDTLSIGYTVYVTLDTGGQFSLEQLPKKSKLLVSSIAGTGINKSKLKLVYLLIGYNIQSKNLISFNLDFLQTELDSY